MIWRICFSYSKKCQSFQDCAFHVIFLILCFSLVIDNLPMKRIWLIFRSGIYPIVHICLSILSQLCCKIKLFSFWVHLNAIPTCVIITNLSWYPIFQDIITRHAYVRIVVFIHFLNPDFVGPIKESWRNMLLYLFPGEWVWHCVYLICPCTGFSMIFQWYFLIDTW